MKELSHQDYNLETVRGQILRLLHESSPMRFTDIMDKLGKPNRTVYVYLKELNEKGLVSVSDHQYSITRLGSVALQKGKEMERIAGLEGRELRRLANAEQLQRAREASLPSPSRRVDTVSLPRGVLERLVAQSRERGIPIPSAVEQALNGDTESQQT